MGFRPLFGRFGPIVGHSRPISGELEGFLSDARRTRPILGRFPGFWSDFGQPRANTTRFGAISTSAANSAAKLPTIGRCLPKLPNFGAFDMPESLKNTGRNWCRRVPAKAFASGHRLPALLRRAKLRLPSRWNLATHVKAHVQGVGLSSTSEWSGQSQEGRRAGFVLSQECALLSLAWPVFVQNSGELCRNFLACSQPLTALRGPTTCRTKRFFPSSNSGRFVPSSNQADSDGVRPILPKYLPVFTRPNCGTNRPIVVDVCHMLAKVGREIA